MPTRFEELLRRTVGLDATTIGSTAIARAVASRMAARRIETHDAYGPLVESSPEELQALIEAVVVPETWLFRGREAFEAVTAIARERLLATGEPSRLKLLSLPCATGEEPFSMAMALMDAGIPTERFRIDAVDISIDALAAAARATFSRNSFRGGDLGFRDRHFQTTADGWRLNDTVRRQVHFRPGNLFDPNAAAAGAPYDIVFCRNLMIYLDRDARLRALAILRGLMTPEATLFVGGSEASILLGGDFASWGVPAAVAFRRKPPAARPVVAAVPPPAWRPPETRAAAPPPTLRTVRPEPAPPAALPTTLDAIRSLADDGKLAEAARRCEEHLRTHPPSAEALHLLGLIRDAGGDLPGAEDAYRKALYLDPHHQQALLHLALLHERRGDAEAARQVAGRLRRLDRRGAS